MADPPPPIETEDPIVEEEDPEEEDPEEIEEEGEPKEIVEEEIEEDEGGGGEEEAKEVPELVKEKRKQRDFEVFVGGLPRDATEDDLEKVFRKAGEVVDVRLVMIPNSNKNKGFAFVRFATVDQAKKAATELKNIVVKGKLCGVIRNNDNETLFVGNICTSWTKDDFVEKLKAFELENLEDVHLIDDPWNKGKNRGFAFLDFSTHMDAVAACSKLQRKDIFFGMDVRAEVSFSKTVEPNEEIMSQVKSVFLDGLPVNWNEAQMHEHFKNFGEIENIQLARNMPTAKRKDFGFIYFTTREAAVDCIEKVNKDGVGEGDNKVLVKATLKRPKRMLPTLGIRGGHIGKGFGMREKQPYGFARPLKGRPARSYELIDRARGFSDRPSAPARFPSTDRGTGFKAAISTRAGRYRSRFRKESTRETPAVYSSRSRDSYDESSSSSRRAPGSHHYYSTIYSQLRGPYSDADLYDPGFEEHDAYDYDDIPGYKRGHKPSYSELDHDMLPSSSLLRRGRSRAAYPHQGDPTYDEHPRVLLDERLEYDRVEYASREYGNRYYSGRGSSRSYY